MNLSHHHVAAVEAWRTKTCGGQALKQFTLMLRYGSGHVQRVYGVYVPPTLESVLDKGRVVGVTTQGLDVNGLASWLLPDSPQHVLLGVTTVDGTECCEAPVEFTWARRALLSVAVPGGLAAGALLCTGWAWTGALSLLVAAYLTMLAQRLPSLPETPLQTPPPPCPKRS
jgi:hypothetical protein